MLRQTKPQEGRNEMNKQQNIVRFKKFSAYFDAHFRQYESECEWYPDTPEGGWRFEIPSQRLQVILSMGEDGKITETRTPAYATRLSQKFIKKLWHELGDVPMNPDTEQLEEGFYIWNAGTGREDIWHWFDEHYDRGVAALLYPEE